MPKIGDYRTKILQSPLLSPVLRLKNVFWGVSAAVLILELLHRELHFYIQADAPPGYFDKVNLSHMSSFMHFPICATYWTCWQKQKNCWNPSWPQQNNKLGDSERWHFAIRLRFRAMAARRHSSVAARMPLFRIFEIQCSRFKTEKLPSAQILRSRIMDRYSGVPMRLCPLKNAG